MRGDATLVRAVPAILEIQNSICHEWSANFSVMIR